MYTPLSKWSTTDEVLCYLQQRNGNGANGSGSDGSSEQQPLLHNTTVLITGASSGIGQETARVLASQGAMVILACRNMDRAAAAITSLTTTDPSLASRLKCLQLDLSNPESVVSCADTFHQRAREEHWPPLQILLLNGGVYSFKHESSPVFGYENTFATNHLGHFQLTTLLLPTLQLTPGSRVVVVASDSHYGQLLTTNMTEKDVIINEVAKCSAKEFSVNGTYCTSKLCNVLFAKSLARRQAAEAAASSSSSSSSNGNRASPHNHPVAVCSLHPGSMIATGIASKSLVAHFFVTYIMSWFTKTLNQGASTSVLCCLLPPEELQGQYFSDCGVKDASVIAQDEKAQDVLWEASEQLLA